MYEGQKGETWDVGQDMELLVTNEEIICPHVMMAEQQTFCHFLGVVAAFCPAMGLAPQHTVSPINLCIYVLYVSIIN